jgi:cell division protein FtsX
MRYLFGIYLVFSVFFSSFVLLIYQNSNQVLFQSKELSTLSFTFKNETTKESALNTAESLKQKYQFSEAIIHTPADQYADFIKSFSMYNQGAFDTEEILQLIPFSVDFVIQGTQDAQIFKKALLQENIFQENTTSTDWITKLKSVASLIEGLGRFLFLFLFASTALMTVATIRILITEDEFKNKIRSYLGESFQTIYLRYIFSAAKLYVLAISIGFLLNFLIYQFLVLKIRTNLKFSFIADRIQYLTTESVFLMLVGFAVAFGLGSFVSLKHLFHRIYNED